MMLPDLAQTVIVLDLDDTLYSERDYQASGLQAVCAHVETLFGRNVLPGLVALQKRGETDLLRAICGLANLPETVKESLLWVYRLHTPTIALTPGVRAALQRIESACLAVAILTDGRSISQRQKLHALGLAHLPAYISEEFGSTKPELGRFRRVMADFPARNYVYVGDNPAKDFLAPNALGWTTIGVRGDGHNIHPQDCDSLSADHLPGWWVSGLSEAFGE